MKDIIVYTTDYCGYCNAAKRWLMKYDLEFTEINLNEGNKSVEFMKSFPHLRTSPQVFCYGKNIGGFTDLLDINPDQL